jgi:IMP-GMP specific 5'-nucleotidase, putative (fragment)
MPHESTVDQDTEDYLMGVEMEHKKMSNISEDLRSSKSSDKGQSLLPHLFPEAPTAVTHHHDTDDEDEEPSSER